MTTKITPAEAGEIVGAAMSELAIFEADDLAFQLREVETDDLIMVRDAFAALRPIEPDERSLRFAIIEEINRRTRGY